jgi:hypothetical protein
LPIHIRNKAVRSVGRWIKHRFSPHNYTVLQYLSWRVFFCTYRRFWSRKREPQLYGFGADGARRLIARIGDVDLTATTKMCRVMTHYGSDKGCVHHNYTMIYAPLLGTLQDRPLNIFELGLGTNAAELKSSMGVLGSPGASLRGWRDLFPRARIYGAYIDRNILFESERIKTYYCDQLDQTAIRELWEQPDLGCGMDILIEDGLHTLEANISFLEGSLAAVRPDGYYIIEDIKSSLTPEWLRLLESDYAKRYPAYEFVYVSLPNPYNTHDNNMLLVHKPAP